MATLRRIIFFIDTTLSPFIIAAVLLRQCALHLHISCPAILWHAYRDTGGQFPAPPYRWCTSVGGWIHVSAARRDSYEALEAHPHHAASLAHPLPECRSRDGATPCHASSAPSVLCPDRS